MQIRFTKQAREEYLRIISVFEEFAGTRSASKLNDRVRQKGETLLKHPYSGPLEPLLSDRKRDYRFVSINKNYRMIYHVTNNFIWIVDIWDRRNDPNRLVSRVK